MLHEFYTSASQQHIRVTPAEINQKRIGHIGWHRKRYEMLWDKTFAPLLPANENAHENETKVES
ncbi:hypothetical protein [Marinobacter sp.]|uniref:hypothetical protein n=1 Tax=Marinobacter sp. TaxID=50741 RepID=UPI001B7BF072|nr:hypothetical protein [Marinobacter sp.]MBQ0831568.1 hypothetical protein [Marinobacter sp.]